MAAAGRAQARRRLATRAGAAAAAVAVLALVTVGVARSGAADRGFQARYDSDSAQAGMVARTGVTYPTARDHSDDLLRLFNTSGALPTTLFIDATGRVVNVHNGGLDQSSLKAAVRQYLGIAA